MMVTTLEPTKGSKVVCCCVNLELESVIGLENGRCFVVTVFVVLVTCFSHGFVEDSLHGAIPAVVAKNIYIYIVA